MEVTIKSEHYRTATKYINPFSCPLARAMQGLFPNDKVSVGPSWVRINGEIKYTFSLNDWGSSIPDKGMSIHKIEKRISEKGTYPNYTFTLIPV